MQTPLEFDIYIRDRDTGVAVLSDRIRIEAVGAYSIGRGANALIMVDVDSVSRDHATLTVTETELRIKDHSANGTWIGEEKVDEAVWDGVTPLYLSPGVIMVPSGATPPYGRAEGTSSSATGVSIPIRPEPRPQASEDVNPFAGQAMVSTEQIRRHPNFMGEWPFIALGGGLGSFVWVDHLRVFGVPGQAIRVFGDNAVPYANYERYCRNSQLPRHERLRSNSISAPDNVWGSPGYATREAWSRLTRGSVGGVGALFSVFGEPVFSITYTPQAGQVFDSLDREGDRIGWGSMFERAKIYDLAKTDDGRFLVTIRRFDDARGAEPGYAYAIASFVHVATGYPAVRFVDDLQDFKAARGPGSERVVNAYDPHEHVYEALAATREPVTCVVRGRGIVASRIVQRLAELHDTRNDRLRIVHLMRSKKPHGSGARFGRAKRPVFNDVEIQPFNWPKACWSGDLRKRMEQAPPSQRAEMLRIMGGTSTAERGDWTELLTRGLRDGWYQKYYGSIKELEPGGADGLTARVALSDVAETRDVEAGYVIDCTGLISELTQSVFLTKVIERYRLPRNNTAPEGRAPSYGGLAVSNAFEIEGLRNGAGRVYASGQITSGGPYAAVDSFLGLQYAALRSTDDLYDAGAPHISGFGPMRSFSEWLRWCQNVPPRDLPA